MKFQKIAAAIILPVFLSSCSPGGESLEGVWISEAYQCPWGVYHTEEVSFSVIDDVITARKITGDECVLAGQVTFSGKYVAGETSRMECITGTPDAPSSSSKEGTFVVNSDGTVAACGMRFRRREE